MKIAIRLSSSYLSHQKECSNFLVLSVKRCVAYEIDCSTAPPEFLAHLVCSAIIIAVNSGMTFVFNHAFFIMFQVVKQLNCTFSEEDKEHNNDRAISKCLKEADLQKLLRVKVRADLVDPILPPF